MASVSADNLNRQAGSSDVGVPIGVEPSMDFMAPMLAGARARGIADAFEMLGFGVVMLDHSGRVLHASARARALMQDAVGIVSDHLVGATPRSNASIKTLIESSLSGRTVGNSRAVIEVSGRKFALRAVEVPADGDSSMQLMKAVLCVSEL